MEKSFNKKDAIVALWKRGNLKYKLDSNQKEMYDLFYNSDIKRHVWLLARRSGKTYTLSVIGIEHCLKKPRQVVKILAPTKLQINTILRPIFAQLLQDCPEELKPNFSAKEYTYFFPNGSEIQLAGTDGGHAEKLRGGDSVLWIIDEAGSCDTLDYIVKNILVPTTLITNGRGILAGTPSKKEDHDFNTIFIPEAEANGTLTIKTINDNPRVTEKQKEDLIKEVGGINSEASRRELFCEIVKSEGLSVLPEFTKELEAKIVKEWERPPFYDAYTAMDVGFEDLTAVLFAYYDFRNGKIIIEDEYDVKGFKLKLPDLAKTIEDKEKTIWYDRMTGESRKVYLRVSDLDYIVMSELSRYSNGKVAFTAAKKDDNEAAINNLRVMLANEKIIINPRCKTLIRHLRNVRWYSESNHNKFARSVDNSHFDYVEALKYLIRHVSFGKNPYPSGYNIDLVNNFSTKKRQDFVMENNVDIFKKIFNVKGKRK